LAHSLDAGPRLQFRGLESESQAVGTEGQAAVLRAIRQELPPDESIDAERVARSVFAVVAYWVTEGEIEDLKYRLPRQVQGLWPVSAA
jgi:uncharacterized protein (DUF2267 family)